jgi:hypothetical protein
MTRTYLNLLQLASSLTVFHDFMRFPCLIETFDAALSNVVAPVCSSSQAQLQTVVVLPFANQSKNAAALDEGKLPGSSKTV